MTSIRRGGPGVATAAVALVALFVALRTALLVTSYDANANWEEPVFLFSGLELARDGVGHVLDHQDDLNHGGSVPLLLLAVPWIRMMGPSLLALKGLAIVWSGLTLIACMALGWRHWSPRTALLFGLCFVLASPTLARLNVTLVGSHPESLLPAMLAVSCYLDWVRAREERRDEPLWSAGLLGLWSGLAVWMSYVAALFVAPVLVARFAAGGARRLVLVTAGLGVGLLPWVVQNLWLRPQGAGLFRAHVTGDAPREWLADAGRRVAELAASFGWVSPVNAFLLAICMVALVLLTASMVGRWRAGDDDAWRLLPFVVAPYLGFSMLLAARITPSPAEGYYYYRFYVALQVACFWVLAIALDRLAGRSHAAALTVVACVLAAGALVGQAGLLGLGTTYTPDLAKDRTRGCLVFGLAETDRATDWPQAIARLAGIGDDACRDRAFGGLGWGIGSRFLASRDPVAARGALELIGDAKLRWAACGGFTFVVQRAPSGAPAVTDPAVTQVQSVCKRPSA